LDLADAVQHVLVYDVGGSHVSAAVCDGGTFTLRGLSRAPLPADGPSPFSAASFKRLIHTLGEAAARNAGIEVGEIGGASLAMPGPFDYENGISKMTHKLQSLYDVDLKGGVAGRFGWEPGQVRFVNDAAAFTLGEVGAGAAKGFAKAIGITLGTGIGCAFATDGRIAIPADQPGGDPGVPPGGEIWNLPYGDSTVEEFVSTRFLRGQYQRLTGMEAEVAAIADAAKGDEPCPELEAEFGAGQRGDAKLDPTDAHCRARQAFLEFGRNLGLVLNEHAAAFKPDVIVLGGGIARAAHLFLPATRKALSFKAEIAISTLMDEAPLAGAGVHWFNAAG
jgi:glucokinase